MRIRVFLMFLLPLLFLLLTIRTILRFIRRRKRVLVIDADFQHPDLAEILDIPAGATWENLARGTGSDEPNGLVRVETGTVPFWFLPLSRESVPEAVAALREAPGGDSFRIRILSDAPQVDISSTEIRKGLEEGLDMSKYLM